MADAAQDPAGGFAVRTIRPPPLRGPPQSRGVRGGGADILCNSSGYRSVRGTHAMDAHSNPPVVGGTSNDLDGDDWDATQS